MDTEYTEEIIKALVFSLELCLKELNFQTSERSREGVEVSLNSPARKVAKSVLEKVKARGI